MKSQKKSLPPLSVALALALDGRHLCMNRIIGSYTISAEKLIEIATASVQLNCALGRSFIDKLALYIARSTSGLPTDLHLRELVQRPIDRSPASLILQIELLNRALRLSKSNALMKKALVWFHLTFTEHLSKDLYGHKIRSCETVLLLTHRQYAYKRELDDLSFILPLVEDIIEGALLSLAKDDLPLIVNSQIIDRLVSITAFSPSMLCKTITTLSDFFGLADRAKRDLGYTEYFSFLFGLSRKLCSFPKPPLVNESLALRIKTLFSSLAINSCSKEQLSECALNIKTYLSDNETLLTPSTSASLSKAFNNIQRTLETEHKVFERGEAFRLVLGFDIIDSSKVPTTINQNAAFILAYDGHHMSLYQNTLLPDFDLPLLESFEQAVNYLTASRLKYAVVKEIDRDKPCYEFHTDFTPPSEFKTVGFIHKNLTLYGGAEHFTQTIVFIYQQLGFNIVDCAHIKTLDKIGNALDGEKKIHSISDMTSAINLIKSLNITLFHSIGQFELFNPIFRFLKVTYVCGQHFYWDYQLPVDSDSYSIQSLSSDNCSNVSMIGDLSCNVILAPNSHYSRELVTKATDIAYPIIYSIPETKATLSLDELLVEVKTNRYFNESILNGKYLISVSGQDIKGYRYVLELIRAYPALKVIVVCNQSSIQEAKDIACEAHASHVILASAIPNLILQSLINHSQGLLSFSVETFGRVVIEALQHRKFVFCFKDAGAQQFQQSPYLIDVPQDMILAGQVILERMGIAPDGQNNTIPYQVKLVDGLSTITLETQTMRICLEHLLSSRLTRVLVVVGSGIGNLVQQTPLIKRLAIQYNGPIDILFLGDYRDSWLIFDNPQYIGKIFLSIASVQSALSVYDLVVATRASFSMQPESLAPYNINPDILRYPSILENLTTQTYSEAMQHILSFKGVLMNQAEYIGHDYFVGPYETPRSWAALRDPIQYHKKTFRIGMHGGSKSGVWASKQWPYYPDLAKALTARGHSVYSFGLSHEYINGSIDSTNLPFHELIHVISDLDFFVGNDSGITNLAAGIGTPVLVLFAPTNPEYRTVARPNYLYMTPNGKECHPCEVRDLDKFVNGKCECISSISLEQVINQLDQLLY